MLQPNDARPERSSEHQLPFIDTSCFLYQMPDENRSKLCSVLDHNEKWIKLGFKMGYTVLDIGQIRQELGEQDRYSPTHRLLLLWGDQNHTVTELFMLFFRLNQFQAMKCIKDLVDERYHRLLRLEHKKRRYDQAQPGTPSTETPTPRTVNIEFREANVEDIAVAINYCNGGHKLGEGAFGVVYKGMWKNTPVAIKQLRMKTDLEKKQLHNEFKYLMKYRHRNVVLLHGYTFDVNMPCLIYEFVSGGSLEHRLSSTAIPPLNKWERFKIIKGTALGLQYLHTFDEKPLIHADIKPGNILLDEGNTPKIGDFGLSREGLFNQAIEVSQAFGTMPYLPEEFRTTRLFSTKVDTFSFGVVLFELITGLPAYSRKRKDVLLSKFVQTCAKNRQAYKIMDESFDLKLYQFLYNVGYHCVSDEASQRPEMTIVFKILNSIQLD